MLNGLKFLSKRQLRHMTYLFSVRVACTVGRLLSTETRRIFWISLLWQSAKAIKWRRWFKV